MVGKGTSRPRPGVLTSIALGVVVVVGSLFVFSSAGAATLSGPSVVAHTYLPLVERPSEYSPTSPKPGYWASSMEIDSFYVTSDKAHVDEFASTWEVDTCGIYKITHKVAEPIASGAFSFTGAYYASGTFDSGTAAHGSVGLENFEITGCGIVSGGPYGWTATWKNDSQPTVLRAAPVSAAEDGQDAQDVHVASRVR